MQQIGNYKVTGTIEEGGMAIVYQGIQQSLNRPVAIKVLKQKFSGDPRVVEYFNRESLIIARLIHPNIIHVIDRGFTEGRMPYFVMDFIKGTDTSKLIRKGGLKFNRKLDIIVQTCKALSYAHKNGVIHRDIKPANILIDTEGNALVTDFGIAQFYEQGQVLKKKGAKEVLGTPSYMSPEQKLNSMDVTFASDIYSLGVVMYELFTETRMSEKLKRPSAISSEIPDALERLMLQCLLPEPEKRPASVEMIKNQLFSMFQGAHIRDTKQKRAFDSVPKMDEIVSVLDVIRESPEGSLYLLKHKHTDQLMVARTFNAMIPGIKTARLLLSLKHDNIISLQGVSGNGGNHIVVMEYLSGGSLADRLVMPHSWQESLRVINDICQGLMFAHNNRITHGNLKPSNILFTDTDRVKLSDFNLGVDNPDPSAPGRQLSELIQADILAAGAIFYKMVIGFSPELKGDSFIPHKQFKTLPDYIKRLIYRLLTQKQVVRFQNMKQVLDEIHTIEEQAHPVDETLITLDGDLSDNTQKTLVGDSDRSSSVFFIVLMFILLCITGVASTFILLYFFAPEEAIAVKNTLVKLIHGFLP